MLLYHRFKTITIGGRREGASIIMPKGCWAKSIVPSQEYY